MIFSLKTKQYIIFLFFIYSKIFSQTISLHGKIMDEQGKPIEYASVSIKNTSIGTATDANGNFNIETKKANTYNLIVKFLGYKTIEQTITDSEDIAALSIKLVQDTKQLNTVEIEAQSDRRDEAGMTVINPKTTAMLPSAFGDFNKVLQSLPGVQSNSELSSTYSVRGGNYDENLIYVNGIEVYRPFLVSSGQQEGLSFVNANLASSVAFSTGGWQSKYGDKLSSVMNVTYKKPKRFEGSAVLGLLGGSMHLGGSDKKDRINFVIGYRNKSGKYLLNSLPVQGQYFPFFNDIQSFTTLDLTKRKRGFSIEKRTELSILASYSQNRYSFEPTIQQSTFGTATEQLLLDVGFDGQEQMKYDTWQGGAKFSHWFTPSYKAEFFVSGMDSREQEYINIEAGYRLCDANIDPENKNPKDKCASIRGIGSLFKYARNSLHARILSSETRHYLKFSKSTSLEFGMKYSNERFTDNLNQYSFSDSLDYFLINPKFSGFPPLDNLIELNTHRFSGYTQLNFRLDSNHKITIGNRIGYWNLNKQLIFSPSLQYAFKPNWKKDVIFKFSIGIYRQPPFYRELRNFSGIINPNLRAQSAINFTAGMDYAFKLGNSPFRFSSEIYYKNMWDVVPYDVDNVRLRFYGTNNAIAHATGIDTRISGEFVKGSESWFSLSFMKTEEKLDGYDWVRRPTDQRVNFAIYFQDHVPKIPAWKVFVSLIFNSGLPFSLPNSAENRSRFTAPAYRRADIGTHYTFFFNDKTISKKFFESVTLGIECLNVFEFNNTISYQWISDFNNKYYAVPNTLSSRFWNLKLTATF